MSVADRLIWIDRYRQRLTRLMELFSSNTLSVFSLTADWVRLQSSAFREEDGKAQYQSGGMVTESNYASMYATATDGQDSVAAQVNAMVQGGMSSIEFSAEDITLEGTVSANGGFSVDLEGSMTARGGEFCGIVRSETTTLHAQSPERRTCRVLGNLLENVIDGYWLNSVTDFGAFGQDAQQTYSWGGILLPYSAGLDSVDEQIHLYHALESLGRTILIRNNMGADQYVYYVDSDGILQTIALRPGNSVCLKCVPSEYGVVWESVINN